MVDIKDNFGYCINTKCRMECDEKKTLKHLIVCKKLSQILVMKKYKQCQS